MTDFFQSTNRNGGHENKEKLIVYTYNTEVYYIPTFEIR